MWCTTTPWVLSPVSGLSHVVPGPAPHAAREMIVGFGVKLGVPSLLSATVEACTVPSSVPVGVNAAVVSPEDAGVVSVPAGETVYCDPSGAIVTFLMSAGLRPTSASVS